MKIATITAAVALCLVLAPPVQADHGCNGTVIAVLQGMEILYVDDRSDEAGEINHWFYLESNGVAGLQSGHGWSLTEDTDHPFHFYDPCDHAEPDTLVI